jgi:hypothetical protein
MNAFARGAVFAARFGCAGEARGPVSRLTRGFFCLLAISSLGLLPRPALGNGGRFEPTLEAAGAEIGDLPADEFPIDGALGSTGQAFAGSPFIPQHESAFFPGPAPACRGCPNWTVQVDALMLWQGAIPSRPLFRENDGFATVLDANDLQTPVTIDPRYAILYHVDDCRSLEVNYFNLWGFEGEAVTPFTNGGYAMRNLAGLDLRELNIAGAASLASIKSLEFNVRRRGWGGIEWLSGFRWLEWNQQLLIADTFEQDNSGFDVFAIGTVNNLYGWQWGGDMMLWNRGDRLRVNGVAKAGVYYNHQAAQRTVYLTNRSDQNSQIIADANDAVSFVGETGVMASYSLTNWLAIRLGYTFFWLGGVATPADQLDTTTIRRDSAEAKVSPYGSVFLQGVQTGIEARW